MTNTNETAATIHPALSATCKECGAAAGAPCAPYAKADISGRTVQVEIGAATYDKVPFTVGHGRLAFTKTMDVRRPGVNPVVTVHTSRMPKAKSERTERLMASEKAGAKALSQEDGTETGGKRPVYVAVFYRSMGDENVAFIAGPMTSAAASRLRGDVQDVTNVVPGTYARVLSSSDAQDWVQAGRVPQLGVRVVTLPSQHGAGGVVRGEDDQETAEDGALATIVSRRPQAVHVQGSWLDALAV
jgi:hypothetical protein